MFFDIHVAGESAGRVVFKLYDDVVPIVRTSVTPIDTVAPVPEANCVPVQTAANFRGLCTGKVSRLVSCHVHTEWVLKVGRMTMIDRCPRTLGTKELLSTVLYLVS